MNNFEKWWNAEGSAILPTRDEDYEEFAKRVSQIAWINGRYMAMRDVEQKAAETLVAVDGDATK